MTDKNPFFGATFGERKALREQAEERGNDAKAVDSDDVEDKAVRTTATRRKSRS